MGQVKEISVVSAVEWLELEKVKEHLRVTHSDDDAYINALMATAIIMIENFTERLWNNYKVVEVVPYDEVSSIVVLSKRKPISVEKIEYYNTDSEQLEEINVSDYQTRLYDNSPSIEFITVPSFGKVPYPLQITYESGVNSVNAVPSPVISAAYLIIGHLYVNRQDVVVGRMVSEMPKASEYLLFPYKLF